MKSNSKGLVTKRCSGNFTNKSVWLCLKNQLVQCVSCNLQADYQLDEPAELKKNLNTVNNLDLNT
jgi:hypothetical protein